MEATQIVIVEHPLGHVEYTADELRQELDDLDMLRVGLVTLIDELAAAKCWDIPYTKRGFLERAKAMYTRTGYSPEFVSKFFDEA